MITAIPQTMRCPLTQLMATHRWQELVSIVAQGSMVTRSNGTSRQCLQAVLDTVYGGGWG
jgi:hypothetical protein